MMSRVAHDRDAQLPTCDDGERGRFHRSCCIEPPPPRCSIQVARPARPSPSRYSLCRLKLERVCESQFREVSYAAGFLATASSDGQEQG